MPKFFPVRLPLAVAASLALSACTTVQTTSNKESESTVQPSKVSTTPVTTIEYRPFEPNTLNALLEAEFAMYRGDALHAAELYARQAQSTHDTDIAILAVQLSQQTQLNEQLIESATVWHSIDPSADEPRIILARDAALRRDVDRAIELTQSLPDDSKTPPYLALVDLYATEDEHNRTKLEKLFQAETKRRSDSVDLDTALAIVEHLKGNSRYALKQLTKITDDTPSHLPAAYALAQIHGELGTPEKIYPLLSESLKDSQHLGAYEQFAKLLVTNRQLDSAIKTYLDYIKLPGAQPEQALVGAQIAIRLKRIEAARTFSEFIAQQTHLPDQVTARAAVVNAQIFLSNDARAAAQSQLDTINNHELLEHEIERAVLNLSISQQWQLAHQLVAVAATSKPQAAANIYDNFAQSLVEANRVDQAVLVLENGLQQFSEHPKLLFTMALISLQNEQYQQFEEQMISVIEQQPNNALALNALGYYLLEQNIRFNEAGKLLERAVQLEPDNAAILDSVGWYHFKTGDLARSLNYLSQAYKRSRDPEIASHLARALRAKGNNEQAIMVYQHALKFSPDSDILRRLSKHLGVSHQSDT